MPHTINDSATVAARKDKKSFTLTRQSVEFLESLRKKRKARAVSAVLEEILQQARQDEQRVEMERDISAYYDALSEEDLKEDNAWGDFSTEQFRRENT